MIGITDLKNLGETGAKQMIAGNHCRRQRQKQQLH